MKKLQVRCRYMVTKSDFKCEHCGKCCTYEVKLSDFDIARFEESGLDTADFVIKNFEDVRVIKFVDDKCFFLNYTEVDGRLVSTCRAYSVRPDVCRGYPFFDKEVIESCKPVTDLRDRIRNALK